MPRKYWVVGICVFGAILVLAILFLSRAERSNPIRRISLQPSHTDSISLPRSTNKLKIAVGAIVSPAKSLAFYEDIFDYIGEELHREIEMVQRKTYAEVNFLIKEGRIEAAFVCSRPYVEGHRDFGLELLCVPVCFGKIQYYSYFIVHKDSPMQKLHDL